MGLLTDTELRRRIRADELLEGMAPTMIDRAVRGCSADMHVGEIYRPAVYDTPRAMKVDSPYTKYTLAEGETAVIRTAEKFKLERGFAAVVLPTSSVSLQGLLMTNPGHVDPGYHGPIHVTVINMGRRPYELRSGDRLLRALIFELEGQVQTSAQTAVPRPSPIDAELLDGLAPDFLSVQGRAAAAAKSQISAATSRSQILQFVIPAVLALLSVLVTSWFTNQSLSKDFERRIAEMEKINVDTRVRKLEADFPTEKRLLLLERQLQQLAVAASTPGR